MTQLSGKLSSQRKQAGHLVRDENRLGQLVTQLSHLIEEQKKADAAAREKRAQEQLARERAAKQQREAAAARRTEANKAPIASAPHSSNPDAIDDDEPPSKVVARNELTPHAETNPGRSFASLRGSLHLPLAGDIIARFGSPRGDAPNWKGLFIRAAAGTPVKSVASGRVVFADWLRGFGNLIIVDHGNQYMTIYGNNQALLKRPGDQVQTGDVI
ncbi:MAG: peptidoglycan DD-metalloendopeptidase family protein, partial [Herbaspirillum sp.]